jgi:phosphohistidine swiveling domain-containing protein
MSQAIDSIDWVFVVKKRLSWLSEMLQVVGTAKQYFQDALGVDFEFRNARMIFFHEYLDANELQAFDEMVAFETRRDHSFLHTVAQRSYQQCNQFTQLGAALAAEHWAQKSNEELVSSLRHFYQEALLMIPVVYFEPNLSESIKSALLARLTARHETEKLEEYFLLLTSTTKELTIVREQRDLLTIGSLIQERPALAQQIVNAVPEESSARLPADLVARLDQHLSDYAWINTDDMFGRPWTRVDLLRRLQYLLHQNCEDRLQAARQRQVERERLRASIIEKLPVDGELLRLVESARENSHLRTHRTEVYIRTFYQASPLIGEAAKRSGLSYQDALYLSIPELLGGLTYYMPISQSGLEQRKNGMAYVMVDRQLTTFFGEHARLLAEEAGLLEHSFSRVTQLEGAIANMGVVRGAVKVVQDISELDKVEDGDILVASMTIPEFIPAMERAAAFVTDEGGITCHAAIISRELNVPCIIGTEIATSVLHDGDFVEVDAHNGIIRVLHQSI